MNASAIVGGVLAALREDANTFPRIHRATQVDVNFAILAIVLPFDHTTPLMKHVDAMIDGSGLEERRSSYFDTHNRFEMCTCGLMVQLLRSRIGIVWEPLQWAFEQTNCRGDLVLKLQDVRQKEMVASKE